MSFEKKNASSDIVPVILCGGSGTRLWPYSREAYPKQFLRLTGHHSLFQQTILRCRDLAHQKTAVAPSVIVAGESHGFLVARQLDEIDVDGCTTILEPASKNTAPAVTLAAFNSIESGLDPLLVVVSSDHAISEVGAFSDAIRRASYEAENGAISIIGVKPNAPKTEYGYINTDGKSFLHSASPVVGFFEKPAHDDAVSYLANGNYFWNAGIFVFKASVWLKAIEKFRPDIFLACGKAWKTRSFDGQFIRPGVPEFETVPADSIDYAVLEKCAGSDQHIKMVTLDCAWTDLGSWDSVWEFLSKDDYGNAHFGDVIASRSENTLVKANSRLVTLVGVENIAVIETADAVLVVGKNSTADVKTLTERLGLEGREEKKFHRKVYRPWGWYDCVDEGEYFKVKRINVYPKASLSLQKHKHRAEHWVVVMGVAEVTIDEKTFTLKKNESTYIPLGSIHRLSNPGDLPLQIIEVQSGKYLGEDDIERFEDIYGRVK
jgi:mannose-1-phosphate guanylyltransferase/mannose-6-phosphate isomerase